MKVSELLVSAFRGITANKLRSILTMLGVMIGVASVILLLAVGNGSAQQINSAIDQLGTDTITVRAGFSSAGKSLNYQLVDQLSQAGLGHVKEVVPLVTANLTASSTTTSQSGVSVIGTTPEYFDVTTAKIASGSGFTDSQVSDASKVAILGATIAEALFPSSSALGQQVSIDGTSFSVIGVLGTQSSTGLQDSNSVIIAPITRIQRSFTGFNSVSSLTVKAIDSSSVAAAEGELRVMLDQLLKVPSSSSTNSAFSITNASSLLETRAESAQSFTTLLGAVAAISLLVGGIGVTNVMLVAVTERTREIGVRKALGATRGAILGQFLVEAGVLTLLGGVFGVLIALIGAQFSINGTQPVILDYSIPLALGVSAAIGVFFGVYPAARAANMQPIQALRSA
ncbi:MAG: ABC transporter permease [Microbacteriaceae bacterium]|nr:ABC transporter permease [Microbacteriaceae bacterium]